MCVLYTSRWRELKAHVRQRAVHGEPHSSDGGHAAPPSHEAPKPIWEQFIEAFKDVRLYNRR